MGIRLSLDFLKSDSTALLSTPPTDLLLNTAFVNCIGLTFEPEVRSDFQKKENQNLTPDMMETFLDGPSHSKCLENAKNDGGRNARFSNFTKTESQFKILFLNFSHFFLHHNTSQYIVVLGRRKNPTLF